MRRRRKTTTGISRPTSKALQDPRISFIGYRYHALTEFTEMVDEDAGSESSYEPEYEVECVAVGDLQLQVLSLLPPPLEYMSTLHARQQEISGRRVWTGSILLANMLCSDENKRLFCGKNVLELGCGTGILGMAVARVARDCSVTLTDGDPLALDLLKRNIQNPDNHLDPNAIKARLLYWSTNMNQDHEFCSWCREAWDLPRQNKVKFDLILAGDVLYKQDLPSLFFATARSLLTTKGVLYLCHVPRANVGHDTVLHAASLAGFSVESESNLKAKSSVVNCPIEDTHKAHIYRMTLL